jgi:hypothetical protein
VRGRPSINERASVGGAHPKARVAVTTAPNPVGAAALRRSAVDTRWGGGPSGGLHELWQEKRARGKRGRWQRSDALYSGGRRETRGPPGGVHAARKGGGSGAWPRIGEVCGGGDPALDSGVGMPEADDDQVKQGRSRALTGRPQPVLN